MAESAPIPGKPPKKQIARLRQLIPFNSDRFDAAMSYLARQKNSSLSQQDMVKLHVMIDVFHVLRFGKPVIGGPLERWKGGTVVASAYKRLRNAGYRWERDQTQPESYRILGKRKSAFLFEPIVQSEESDFSPSELDAMQKAWDCVMSKNFEQRADFFHSNKHFMGRAWLKAGTENAPVDWNDIIDAYAELDPSYKTAQHIKTLVSL
jgi:uncharacterized phage-associated protein